MIEILAPAKLNLGLELLGRRADGYHEIRTVMTPVSLVDRLRLVPAREDRLSVGGLAVPTDGNLVTAALDTARVELPLPPLDVTLSKRIPLAAGLGGGSSDAAAALTAAAELASPDGPTLPLARLAEGLGSDVSFFLSGESALVSGRGEVVTPVAAHPPLHAVIVVPRIAIPKKTATLYSRITPRDFTDGSAVAVVAADLAALPHRPDALPNAFRQALYALLPDLVDLDRKIEVTTALPVNLSGAGPAHYVLCAGAEHASCISRRLRASLRRRAVTVHAVRTISGRQVLKGTHAAGDA